MTFDPLDHNWTVREQVVEDPTSGLTFHFELSPDGPILRVTGDALPLGNREIHFDASGWEESAETNVGGRVRRAVEVG